MRKRDRSMSWKCTCGSLALPELPHSANCVAASTCSPECSTIHGASAQGRRRCDCRGLTPGRQSYQPKTVGPAFVGVIRIRQRPCLIMAAR